MQQPNQISDFDLMTELNNLVKHSASQLTSAILESGNPQLRQQFQSSLQTCLQHHQQLSQLMMQKGYYNPLPSSPEMLQTMRQQIEMANAQVGSTFSPSLTQQVQPNIMAPATGAGPIPPQPGTPGL